MAKFLIRRFVSLIITMFIVSLVVFLIAEVAPGDVVRHMLGQFATPEQEASMREQLGLNRPVWARYLSWLVGSDWLWGRPRVGMPLRELSTRETESTEWWAEEPDGTLIRWRMEGLDLIAIRRQPDGSTVEMVDNGRWNIDVPAELERLRSFRGEVTTNQQLLETDQEAILDALDRLIELLEQREDMSSGELVAAIQDVEQDLDALQDPTVAEQREALQAAARVLSRHDLLLVIEVYEGLKENPADEEFLRSVPNQLSQATILLTDARPDLAEQLRHASKGVLQRDVEKAISALEEVVEPVRELTAPLVELAQALETEEYVTAADLLASMFDPAGEPDEALMAVMADAFRDMAKVFEDPMPEFSQDLDQAAKSLKRGDAGEAHAALQHAAALLREASPAIAGHRIAEQAHVARYFWGVDTQNHVVLWKTHAKQAVWQRTLTGGSWFKQSSGPVEYIPLQRGLLRGDPGQSMRTRQPVKLELMRRLRNSAILAGIAFVVVMPLALLLGLIAGLNEGKPLDRILSIFGLVTTASPNFATGVVLIVIFSAWLKVLPGATVFTSSSAIFENPKMLALPVATLTLIELGYVLRMTRASMVEVMRTAYIRTAFLKGLPYWRIVFKHAVRNALMAPITVIMLHVNWLMGGIVVVESIFGYPGLGTFLLNSALYKDVFGIEAGAMVLVTLAVGTQLIADIIYTFLNPRIRYS